jgi:hypothetical protein
MTFTDTKEGQTHSLPDDFQGVIGMMRQWLNEDRITDPKKMVTTEELAFWINKIIKQAR